MLLAFGRDGDSDLLGRASLLWHRATAAVRRPTQRFGQSKGLPLAHSVDQSCARQRYRSYCCMSSVLTVPTTLSTCTLSYGP